VTSHELLGRLTAVRSTAAGWVARCPAHEDHRPSLSIAQRDGRILVKCHAGCLTESIVQALGLNLADLFVEPLHRDGQQRTGVIRPETTSTLQPPPGCTLARYAAAKRFPLEFLRQLGLADTSYNGRAAVRIPYLDSEGFEAAVRYRLALEGNDRFRWKAGAKPCLYGLWRLKPAGVPPQAMVLVEGESDAQTLWKHGVPALGLPGATSWRETWAESFAGVPVIYVVIERDRGGQAVLKWLETSSIRDRVRLVELEGAKDPSELCLADPESFPRRWQAALEAAVPWAEYMAARAAGQRDEAWVRCAALAKTPQILDRFSDALAASGLAGEVRAGKLLYLIVTSRLLDRPVSAAVKGPSSAGKSYLCGRVLDFFPPRAYYALSAMSEKALAYSKEPLEHRILVVYEAAGLRSQFASYLVRSLLSEGRVRYETVEKTAKGLKAKLIEREGPTGLLVTTTAINLHEENETRLLEVPVTDTREQTLEVLRQLARDGHRSIPDVSPWHALQEWLEGPKHRVAIPYAESLAILIPPVHVRLRRDFAAVLALIKANAILHHVSRERDAAGQIVATLEDYSVVRELIADLVSEGVDAAVSNTVRETVEAVNALLPADKKDDDGVPVAAVATRLKIDRSAALRRVRVAIDKGYLKNLEEKKGRRARLILGEYLPAPLDILPAADDPRLQGCTVAADTQNISLPPSRTAGPTSNEAGSWQPDGRSD
jgi:hypothetical protein